MGQLSTNSFFTGKSKVLKKEAERVTKSDQRIKKEESQARSSVDQDDIMLFVKLVNQENQKKKQKKQGLQPLRNMI